MNNKVKEFLKQFIIVNSSRKYLEVFVKHAAKSVPKGGRVLDAGAGDCPYKHYFDHARYESADFCQVDKLYGTIDYVCDLSNIPIGDGVYDLVLLTQVLEHIPEPIKVLTEMHRILKPDSCLWLSVPLFYEEHERPHDYYRYTQYGLKYLLEKAGFEIKEIYWLEGFCGTISYQLFVAARYLPIQKKHYGGGFIGILSTIFVFIVKIIFVVLSIIFYALDMRHKYTDQGLCKNYCVVAVKK